MTIIATSIDPGTAVAARRGLARIGDFLALTKPRVMSLVVFTAMVGFTIAPGPRDAVTGAIAIFCIALGAAGAGALNMWHEAALDAAMTRTAGRPIPRGRVSRTEALAFGIALSGGSVAILGFVNLAAAALLAFTVFFYVVVYTMWLKPRTPQNIVIGGAAGALPPVIGWLAASGDVGVEPLVLFAIILLWTPPHFWALSLNRVGEYARAGIPMLPVVAGRAATKRQIVIYSTLLAAAALLPYGLGFTGGFFGAVAGICNAVLLLLAIGLRNSTGGGEAVAARRLFGFSILYLFLLFAALLAETVSMASGPTQ